ncbi:hypothetical protein QFZ67_003746 [Streptomyces sp. V1I1]|nr:hypothetical protein [Streptomyces sp. V1I1]
MVGGQRRIEGDPAGRQGWRRHDHPPRPHGERFAADLHVRPVVRDLPDRAGQIHRIPQALRHPASQLRRPAVHQVGLGPPAVGVVGEAAAAPGKDQRPQQRDFRRVGTEHQVHRSPGQGASRVRGHVERVGEPLPERAGVQCPGAFCLPGGVGRKPSRHPVQAHERHAEEGDRRRSDLGDQPPVAVVDAVQAQDLITLLVLRVHLQADLPAEVEHPLLALAQPGAARRDHRAPRAARGSTPARRPGPGPRAPPPRGRPAPAAARRPDPRNPHLPRTRPHPGVPWLTSGAAFPPA